MKGCYIKQLNTCFIVFNKSGSLLFLNTLYKFCKFKNFNFDSLTSLNFSELKNENTKFIFVIRNPYERFLTCFWRWFLEKNFYGNVPTDEDLLLMQDFINNELEYFIDNYYSIIAEKNDYHLAPQKYQMLMMDCFDKIRINKHHIETLYSKNYTYLKLETFHLDLNRISNMRSPYEYETEVEYKYKENLDYLENIETEDLFVLSDFYFGTRNQLEKQHHHINKNVIVSELQNKKINNILDDEMVLYGYKKTML